MVRFERSYTEGLTPPGLPLHSTMVRFELFTVDMNAIIKESLHSTMVRFEPKTSDATQAYQLTLHSTMVRFEPLGDWKDLLGDLLYIPLW